MKSWLLLIFVVFELVRGNPCPVVESLNVTDGIKHENGSIVHSGIEFPSGAWYESEIENETVVLGCPCVGRACMFKCCPDGEEYVGSSCVASNATEPFSPPVYKELEPSDVKAHEAFFYLHGRSCDDSFLADSALVGIHIQEDSSLVEMTAGGSVQHPAKRYCVEMRRAAEESDVRLIAAICYNEEDGQTDDSYFLYTAYAVGLMISVPFLLATFLVYALIPELKNLHGMCLMAYCGGLIVAFPFLAYLKLHVGEVGVSMSGCYAVAFIVYYAFQTSFFWLNVMCFDIWRTFSGYRGGGTTKRRENKRFAMYAVYAWGLPLALTAVTAAMQFSDVGRYIVTPGFGSVRCWFNNWLSELLYFFIPVLILVVCNVTFFSVTAHRIRSIKQETAILKSAESSRSDKLKKDKQRYGLYLKLFMVMGVNWTVELISFAVGGSNWYWLVVDISNMTLGIFIFFIFVWKKKVRLLVQKRFRRMQGMEPTGTDSRGGRWTTTSAAPTEEMRISADETTVRLKEFERH